MHNFAVTMRFLKEPPVGAPAGNIPVLDIKQQIHDGLLVLQIEILEGSHHCTPQTFRPMQRPREIPAGQHYDGGALGGELAQIKLTDRNFDFQHFVKCGAGS
jgi:hypothetical protein